MHLIFYILIVVALFVHPSALNRFTASPLFPSILSTCVLFISSTSASEILSVLSPVPVKSIFSIDSILESSASTLEIFVKSKLKDSNLFPFSLKF